MKSKNTPFKLESNFSDNQILYGLACLSLNPSLQSALILDASTDSAKTVPSILYKLLEAAGEPSEKPMFIPSDATEDELWGHLSFSCLTEMDKPIVNIQSLLVQKPDDNRTRIIIIPDLARLGFYTKRSVTVLLDAPIVHLERHNFMDIWSPKIRCIAFCKKNDLPLISCHLLDRFSVRLDATYWNDNILKDRTADLLDMIEALPRKYYGIFPSVPEEIRTKVEKGTQIRPQITSGAAEKILEYGDKISRQGHRREIALGRMAIAIAMLQQSHEVRPDHVQTAATLQGFYTPKTPRKELDSESVKLDEKSLPDTSKKVLNEINETEKYDDINISQKPEEGKTRNATDSAEINADIPSGQQFPRAYPEDNLILESVAATLRPLRTARRYNKIRAGQIIGSVLAENLDDISVFETIRTAAPHQKFRGKKLGQPLIIKRPDLRQNLRTGKSGTTLIILADQSDSVEESWEQILSKELDTAYSERYLICLITLGTKDDSLRSCVHTMTSRQIASVRAAFRKPKGNATPLAHGLLMVRNQIDRIIRHGRDAVHEVKLIVATDARANVPLQISRDGIIRAFPSLQAFEDALKIAGEIRRRPKVKVKLITPKITHHKKLPWKLSLALGAEYENNT